MIPIFRCDYHSAMFANEDRGQASPVDGFFEAEAARFHEAGHAVVGYALGLALRSAFGSSAAFKTTDRWAMALVERPAWRGPITGVSAKPRCAGASPTR